MVVPGDEADGAGNVDEGVGAVEEGEGGLVAGHEPVLDAVFGHGEEEAQGAELLEFEDGEAVGFGNVPDGLGEDLLGYCLCEAVEEVGNNPVEHFDQKGKFLEDAAVDVVGEAGGIRGICRHSTKSPPLWKVF